MADGLKGFHFTEMNAAGQVVPAGQRAEYFPVQYLEPMPGNAPALGLDLAAQPQRRAALELAARTGQPTATAPSGWRRKPGSEAGFLVFVPLFDRSVPDNRPRTSPPITGFAVAVFSVADWFTGSSPSLNVGITVKLYDESTAGQMLYANTPEPATNRTVSLEFANRRWVAAYTITPAFRHDISWFQSWFVLLAGLGFTLLTTAYLYRGWQQTTPDHPGQCRAAGGGGRAPAGRGGGGGGQPHQIRFSGQHEP